MIMCRLWLRRSVNETVCTRVRVVNKKLFYRTYMVIQDCKMKVNPRNFSQFQSYKSNNQISFYLMIKMRLILIKTIFKVSMTMMKFKIKLNCVLLISVSFLEFKNQIWKNMVVRNFLSCKSMKCQAYPLPQKFKILRTNPLFPVTRRIQYFRNLKRS